MKYLLFLLVSSLGMFSVQGQTQAQAPAPQLAGKWYTFSLDPILVMEYNFSPTTIITKKLNWDLKPSPESDTATIVKVVHRKNAQYYLLKNKANPGKVMVKVFSVTQPGTAFSEPDMSETRSVYGSQEAALKFVTTDTIKRPGLMFYSHKEIERMQSLTDAAMITKVDTKKYLANVIAAKELFEQYSKRHMDEMGIIANFSFISNAARVSLAQTGYNPLIGDKELELLNDKFKDDAEIKQLVEKAFKVD